MEVIFSSSYDDRNPPTNIFTDNKKDFFSSTGMFPQEITIQFNTVKNLSKKLLSNSLIENCALSDISLEFRPGLILSSIIEGSPLILKNLPNLPTIVLERFNELLATQHSLTINEDIHNTFTKRNDKELSNFSDKFRIFGTSQTNEVNKLSDAVLSRCSLVYVSADLYCPPFEDDDDELSSPEFFVQPVRADVIIIVADKTSASFLFIIISS